MTTYTPFPEIVWPFTWGQTHWWQVVAETSQSSTGRGAEQISTYKDRLFQLHATPLSPWCPSDLTDWPRTTEGNLQYLEPMQLEDMRLDALEWQRHQIERLCFTLAVFNTIYWSHTNTILNSTPHSAPPSLHRPLLNRWPPSAPSQWLQPVSSLVNIF